MSDGPVETADVAAEATADAATKAGLFSTIGNGLQTVTTKVGGWVKTAGNKVTTALGSIGTYIGERPYLKTAVGGLLVAGAAFALYKGIKKVVLKHESKKAAKEAAYTM